MSIGTYTKTKLEDLYWGQGYSMRWIAALHEMPYMTMSSVFRRLDITKRTQKEGCRSYHGTPNLFCKVCTKAVKKVAHLERNKNFFCSKQCYWQFLTLGQTPEHRHLLNRKAWKLVREKALLRDEYKCQSCQSDQLLHVHHVEPRAVRKDKTYEIANLVTLCAACHRRADTELLRKRRA